MRWSCPVYRLQSLSMHLNRLTQRVASGELAFALLAADLECDGILSSTALMTATNITPSVMSASERAPKRKKLDRTVVPIRLGNNFAPAECSNRTGQVLIRAALHLGIGTVLGVCN